MKFDAEGSYAVELDEAMATIAYLSDRVEELEAEARSLSKTIEALERSLEQVTRRPILY